MNITDYPIMVVVCHIAKTAGLKMPRELKSAPIAIVKRSWQVDFERLRGPLLSDTLLVGISSSGKRQHELIERNRRPQFIGTKIASVQRTPIKIAK
jgi:hypothetical protein